MKTFYVKRGNKLLGPLSATQVASSLSKGLFTSDDRISPDRVNWHPMDSFVLEEVAVPPQIPSPLPFTLPTSPQPPESYPQPPPAPKKDDPYVAFWKNSTVFHGRATRSEYWVPTFINLGISAVLYVGLQVLCEIEELDLSNDIATGLLVLYGTVILVPSSSLSVRRLHDLNYSGWLLLTTFIPLIGTLFFAIMGIFFCTEGTKGPNKFGPDPKA